ncbi:bifunctional folylpolyglutamate synthase/dihydrofolate synthase [Thalassobacillus hwangdonensis]|uniref:tetrahydrofolate synthase n=1 Tax=Thalassobacillus hwangdonensis TaxID=546108 RepID=A0ABW3KZE4_9BACI
MNYQQAIDWIHSREKFKIKPGLKRMEWMMEKLGHPERKIKAIHIAGTNGKGSTLTFLRALLQEQGFRIGTFTSPYVLEFNERISVDGVPITDDAWVELVETIKPLTEELAETELGEPTEFEVITAMAISYFSNHPIDFAIFETGLGGRYDSTNIITPLLSIITNVGMDHMNILGDTYEKIATEKAGIIKAGAPVVSGVEEKTAKAVIADKAAEVGAKLYELHRDFQVKPKESMASGERFSYKGASIQAESLVSSLKGAHQVTNASLALKACEVLQSEGYRIDMDLLHGGLQKAYWPGRFELVATEPDVILDGAHNKEGTKALIDALSSHYPSRNIHLLYAALEDKPLDEMLALLHGRFASVTFTIFDFPRAMPPEKLKEKYVEEADVASDWRRKLASLRADVSSEEVIVISGSLYFISEVKKAFQSPR